MPQTANQADQFPIPVETLLASIFALLKERGAVREIAILMNSVPRGFESNYDNWNGGTYTFDLELAVELGLFSRLSESERDEAAKLIAELTTPFFATFENEHFGKVWIKPRAVENPQWRSQADEYLRGNGVNNQGRVKSDNLPNRSCDGLLFRSEPEINLYRAFKDLGVTFAPLPVFLRGGKQYQRLEPDFVIIKDGVVMVVEVDGDTYHRESAVVAHQRLAILDHEGAKIERVGAELCETPELAKACARKLVGILEKRIAQGRR